MNDKSRAKGLSARETTCLPTHNWECKGIKYNTYQHRDQSQQMMFIKQTAEHGKSPLQKQWAAWTCKFCIWGFGWLQMENNWAELHLPLSLSPKQYSVTATYTALQQRRCDYGTRGGVHSCCENSTPLCTSWITSTDFGACGDPWSKCFKSTEKRLAVTSPKPYTAAAVSIDNSVCRGSHAGFQCLNNLLSTNFHGRKRTVMCYPMTLTVSGRPAEVSVASKKIA